MTDHIASSEAATSRINESLRILADYCQSFNLNLSSEALSRVINHLELMLQKNQKMNLTSIRDFSDALVLHALDSLLFDLPLEKLGLSLSSQENQDYSSDYATILDMGTGGGFPGIPIACTSNSKVLLLDSVGKKVNACNEFCCELGIEETCSAIHGRLEEIGKNPYYQGAFNFVVARALAPLDILLEYATPFLCNHGCIVLGKANPSRDEIEHAHKVAKICGLQFVSRETYELPHKFGHREFFVYEKARKSRVNLPRANGEARNKPLCTLKVS